MITTWNYVVIPSGINLNVPLMPLRPSNVSHIRYGIDLAWISEVTSLYDMCARGISPTNWNMYEYPHTLDYNHCVTKANSIRDSTSTTSCLLTQMPSASVLASVSADSIAGRFSPSAPPSWVASGDVVRSSQFSDIYDWLRPIKGCFRNGCSRSGGSVTSTAYSYTSAAFESNPPKMTPRGALYYYVETYTEGAWSWRNGNGICWATACSDMTISIASSMKSYYFDSAVVYLQVKYSLNGVVQTAYFKVGANVSSSGDSLSVVVPGSNIVGLINRAKSYFSAPGGSGTYTYYISLSGDPAVALHFAPDYLVPSAA